MCSVEVVLVIAMALLMGDSIFSRLISRYGSQYHPLSKSCCISGAKVETLKALAKTITEWPKVVVLLVGINNLTHPHVLAEVWKVYVSLVNLLLRRGVTKLYVCPLLPVANIYLNHKCGGDLALINFWIRGLFQKKNVTVLSFEHIFLSSGIVNPTLYCPVIKNRPDYLHPNSKGLSLIHSSILNCIM